MRIGCIGAGNFARGTIFPHLRKIRGVRMEAVATASGVAAESARRSDGFQCACAPVDLLTDSSIDAVFILSRHDSHARFALEALERGKPAFIEKPLCVRRDELLSIRTVYAGGVARSANPFLMVGFNRRFAPQTEKLREFFSGRQEPMLIHIRVNAGYIPREHWTQQATGGRIVGELCHFVDWARAVVGRPIESVLAKALPDGVRYHRDNLAVTISFTDGSIASLLYLANGDKTVPKEYFEVFCEGAVARLNDFRTLELVRKGKKETHKSAQDKGHRDELERTVEAILFGKPSPIPPEEIFEVTEITFRIEDALGRPLPAGASESALNGVEADFEIGSRSVGD